MCGKGLCLNLNFILLFDSHFCDIVFVNNRIFFGVVKALIDLFGMVSFLLSLSYLSCLFWGLATGVMATGLNGDWVKWPLG